MSDYAAPASAPQFDETRAVPRPAFGVALSVLEWTDPSDERSRGLDEEREPELAWAVGQGRGGDAG